MRWSAARAPQARWIATAPGDSPLLPRDLVQRLAVSMEGKERGIALAQTGGEWHPVAGLWPVALADDLERALAHGIRKVLHWTDRHGTVPVPFPMARIGAAEVDPFFNANTPEELETLRGLAGKAAT
jgi:molybdopterin-guanine dinucleotide biosynthesis protein A